MRVVSGIAKGHKLRSLQGLATRPTTDKVKESLFNIIASIVPGAYVLDLFAGTGSLGIEALSRGSEFAVFVDKNPAAVKVIKENLIHTKLSDHAHVFCADYSRYIHQIYDNGRKFDIIFLDPPYCKDFIIPALEEISKKQLLARDGMIVIERDKEDYIPEKVLDLSVIRNKDYGRTVLTFMKQYYNSEL